MIIDNDLSFDDISELERTKHVHRLHPYLGKFIPQLVEIFLNHYFDEGSLIIDPFAGSGTTLVEANVLGINSIGIDVSVFNCLLIKTKTYRYDLKLVCEEIIDILGKLKSFREWFDREKGQQTLFQKFYPICITENPYLLKWFAERTLQELLFYKSFLQKYKNEDILKIIMSRSARSARLIKHYELDQLNKEPTTEPYECKKHLRICEPADEAYRFIERYSWDTIERIQVFDEIRRDDISTDIVCGDSITVDLGDIKADGIFTSPPYFGLIDYHEQHRYAYELLNIKDNSDKEIGAMKLGKSKKAQNNYKEHMISVFKNMNKF